MARAESKMIMGYLPIEERNYPALLSLVAPASPAVRLLDPFTADDLRSVRTYRAALEREDDLPIWQGRYHDHIIRGEADLNVIRAYIADNPARWSQDTFFT